MYYAPMFHTTIQERGYCSRAGYDLIDDVLARLCILYNAALEERIGAYRNASKTITAFDQYKSLTMIRQDDPEGYGSLDAGVARSPIARLDKAMNAFFRRAKRGGAAGYPRFRSRSRYVSLDVPMPRKRMLVRRGRRVCLRVKGLPTIELRPVRPLPDMVPKTIRVVRRPTGVTVDLSYEIEKTALPAEPAAVGIDLGVRKRMTLSTGEIITRAEVDRASVERQHQRMSAAAKGTARRRREAKRLARIRRRQAVSNRNACHRITTALIRRFGVIAVEDLQIGNMARAGPGKAGLNRSMLEQTWGLLLSQLRYKAEWAGRELVEVPARNTTRRCSRCGALNDPGSSERYECASCGLEIDRDLNAALNILRAGISALAGRQKGASAGHANPSSQHTETIQ